MKLNCWLMLGVMVATSATAQNSTNSLPAMPPPITAPVMAAPAPAVTAPAEVSTNAPAKKTIKKKKKKTYTKAKAAKAAKTVFTEAPATLTPGPAEIVVNNVNVRGQAGLKGEVITHVQKGDTVTVLSQITLDKHKTDEPAQWAQISLPTNVSVWVDSKFIDATTKAVTVKKLNLRAGPGENYSVLGVIEKGDTVTEEGAKGDWTKIDAPTNAYAFIAAMYLKQESSGNLPMNPPPSTETPVPTTVAATEPMVAPAPGGVPTVDNTAGTTAPVDTSATTTAPGGNIPVIIQTNIIVVADTNVPPPPPRVVTHEGSVRNSVSIVAPTYFELYNPDDGKCINYLYSTTTNLNLARYNGLHISVTGEEGLDERWAKTPVLTVQKIYVLSTNGTAAELPAPAPAAAPAKKPWYHFGL